MTVSNSLLNDSTASSQGATPVASNGQSQTSGSDMFMTLLMAQIKNQNPLDPADPSQFVNQLVQMNQMQTSLGMLSQLKDNAMLLRELQGLGLGNQVGNRVLVQSNTVQLDGAPLAGRLTLSGAENQVTLQLTGADGKLHQIDLGAQPAGEVAFSVNPADYGLAAGSYALSATTASRATPMLELAAVVQGVRLPVQGGEPMLTLSGLGDVPASSVSRLLGNTSSSAS
ncbi:flagellar hook capping FlgD N-terminal domain-containing protein [Pseudogulbenkiania subflava]|uniref:Basal-body rod modification protein FlgD n=1 Tax=Pseudogulbenkiania subflava DSM 22618 TaxID=1123014 RepID=A0A1Y6BE33_9NEIS|nr:flagellar hook capping FlgD N-terminal domain-containing protein [Pseudogulbenkiania subflava]SMF06830.1 flagellar basal-body rod modification protein FlgD [Pseudogulbenkiania subflava DSM 22618]